MAFLTKYGSLWGLIPSTTGRVFWVAPSANYTVDGVSYSASNDNDGLSPERAVRTVVYALSLATASVNDVIVLLPGAHSVSTTITVSKAGILITGIPGAVRPDRIRSNGGGKRARTTITTTETTGAIFTVTATDIEIAYLHFLPITGGSGISISNAADYAYVHDCTWLIGTADGTATFGVAFPLGTGTTTANDNSVVRNCYFLTQANTGPAVRAAGTCIGLQIDNCTFELQGSSAWDDVIESTLAGSLGLQIRDCDFFTPTSATTVMTDCIDTTGMTVDGSTQAYRCYFPTGSDGFEATATADIVTAENYLASTTSGAVTGSA